MSGVNGEFGWWQDETFAEPLDDHRMGYVLCGEAGPAESGTQSTEKDHII